MIFKFHHTTFAAFFPTVWKTTSASASAAGAVGNGAGPPASAATFPRPDKPSDMGVLKKQQRRLDHVVCPTSCPEDSVAYCYGEHNATIGPACGEDCCISDDNSACDDFTGCVERDGSCTGYKACYDAYVPDGIEKSCIGVKACAYMGDYYGKVGSVSNSCNNDFACYDLGNDGGEVGNISNSCNNDYACAYMGDYHGKVGSVSDSCNDDFACYYLGYNGGEVGNISNSCNNEHACAYMGGDYGKVESVTGSCNNVYACYDLGYDGGEVGNISNSCNSKKACFELAERGYVKSITGSCNSDAQQPCRQLSSSNSSTVDIGNIVPLKRKGRMTKYSTADITMCNEDCDKNVDCSSIKWRQGVQKPCRIFKGGYSGKCGKRDLCIDK